MAVKKKEGEKPKEEVEKPEGAAKPEGSEEKPKTYTEAEFQAALKKAQKEADKKIADAEAKAKLSEDERLKSDLADAQAQLRERDARDAVKESAAKSGVNNPKTFYNAYKDEFKFDDKGQVTNLNEIIESAKTESPELFSESKPTAQGSADAGEGKGAAPALTKEAIEKMSEQEIMDNMDAIDAFLASSAS